jgi:hypothetical protein
MGVRAGSFEVAGSTFVGLGVDCSNAVEGTTVSLDASDFQAIARFGCPCSGADCDDDMRECPAETFNIPEYSSTHGSMIRVGSSCSLRASHSTFRGKGFYGHNGGAINSDGTVTIEQSVFSGFVSARAAFVWTGGDGHCGCDRSLGSDISRCAVQLNYGLFSRRFARNGMTCGGQDGCTRVPSYPCSVIDAPFIGAIGEGGAIFSTGMLRLSATRFANNTAGGGTARGNGLCCSAGSFSVAPAVELIKGLGLAEGFVRGIAACEAGSCDSSYVKYVEYDCDGAAIDNGPPSGQDVQCSPAALRRTNIDGRR